MTARPHCGQQTHRRSLHERTCESRGRRTHRQGVVWREKGPAADICCGVRPATSVALKQRLTSVAIVSAAGLPLSSSSLAACADWRLCSTTERSVSLTSSASRRSSSIDRTSSNGTSAAWAASSSALSCDKCGAMANTERSGSVGRGAAADTKLVAEGGRVADVLEAVEAREDEDDTAARGEDEEDAEVGVCEEDKEGERVAARDAEAGVDTRDEAAALVGDGDRRCVEPLASDFGVNATFAAVVLQGLLVLGLLVSLPEARLAGNAAARDDGAGGMAGNSSWRAQLERTPSGQDEGDGDVQSDSTYVWREGRSQ